MHNVEYKVAGDILTITVNVGPQSCTAAPPSSTGKTMLVGTTGGQLPVPSPKGWQVGFALNVTAKKQ